MATPWGLTCLFIGLNIVEICQAHPMEQLFSGREGPNGQIMGVLVAGMISVCAVFVLIACVCCKRRSGFKENEPEKKVFRNSPISASVINETSLSGDDPGHVNPIANAEFTIFTPLSPPHHNNNVFRSQPPVICYTTENEIAPEFNKAVNPQIDGIDVSEWFADTEYDFPRSRLKYIRELGTGWFGRVVEGEAHGISSTDTPSSSTWTPVAVRILESSASAHEQAQFLHEAALYRIGAHPNMLRLLGRSLEATPLLLIQEYCPKGDLKKFLLENRECKDSELMAGIPLRYCTQLSSAVEFLHDKNMSHLDLAARSCQISPDLNLKLGDYGLGVSHYPNDYYQGTPSIPVRWCAPESVHHTNTTLQPKQVTLEANIWSLAVTFWEICEWGRLPYDWLTDDEVVSQVMGTPHMRLPRPTLNAYYIPPIYRLMEYCWLPSSDRPQINQIYSMLVHLSKSYASSPSTQPATNDFSMENFDLRWESLKPNTIIKTDNEIIKSASLTNLHGSFENLADEVNDPVIQMDSWLENVATHTGDIEYVRGLSEAIHELDTALASEQTSSSSSFEPTPLSSLGAARSETILHTDDSNFDSLIFPKRSESGSETEDETWRRRIERGAYSEKVRQKSKSVADLMILTHIDMNTVKDIFQEELKKLQEERRESLLFVPVQNSGETCDVMSENKSDFINSLRSSEPNSKSDFKESQIEESLFKSIDIDARINNSVPFVSDSHEAKIKLCGFNQTEAIFNEKSNFDTVLQQEPVLNITIEPTQLEISSSELRNRIVEATDNQNILSNDSLVDNITANKTNIVESDILGSKPLTINTKEIPSGQKFIDNERQIEFTTDQKQTEKSVANLLENEVITNITKLYATPSHNTTETSGNILIHKKTLIAEEATSNKAEIKDTNENVPVENETVELLSNLSQNEIASDEAILPDRTINMSSSYLNKNLAIEEENILLREEIRNIAESKIDEIIAKAILVTRRNESLTENNINGKHKLAELASEIDITENLEFRIDDSQKENVELNNTVIEKVPVAEMNIYNAQTVANKNSESVGSTTMIIPKSVQHEKLVLSKIMDDTREKEIPEKEILKEKTFSSNDLKSKQINILDQDLLQNLTKLQNFSLSSEFIENEQVQMSKEMTNLSDERLMVEEKGEIEKMKEQKTQETETKLEDITMPGAKTLNEKKDEMDNKIREAKSRNKLKQVNLMDEIITPLKEEIIDHRKEQRTQNVEQNLQETNIPLDITLDIKQNEIDCSREQETQEMEKKSKEINSVSHGTPTERKIDRKQLEIPKPENSERNSIETIVATNILLNLDEGLTMRENIVEEETQKLEEIVKKSDQTKYDTFNISEKVYEAPAETTDKNSDKTDINLITTGQELEENILNASDMLHKASSKSGEDAVCNKEELKILKQNEQTEGTKVQKEMMTNKNLLAHLVQESVKEENNISSSTEEKRTENEICEPVKKGNVEYFTINRESIDKFEFTEPITALPDLIEISNKISDTEISNIANTLINFDEFLQNDTSKEVTSLAENRTDILVPESPNKTVKTDELSLIQNFINTERNNNQDEIIPTKVTPEIATKSDNNSNIQSLSSDLTSDLLDTSNVEQINQVFNVFNVTVDHKTPLECFSPVKSYYPLFKQNEIMTDINSLLDSDNEDKNACHRNTPKNFLPFTNGISSDISNKIMSVLNQKEDDEPEKLAEIASDYLKDYAKKITNGHDSQFCERPKKLSEIVLESLKASISEDSGFASVQCEEKLINGAKDSEDSSEDLLKISADSLDDILSNSEENLVDKFEMENYEVIHEPKKLSEIALENLKNIPASPEEMVTSFVEDAAERTLQQSKKLTEVIEDTLNRTFIKNEELVNLPDIILDNLQNKTFVKDQNNDILINITDSPVKSLISDKYEENLESAIEDLCVDKRMLSTDSPRISDNILDSLPCNSPVTSESTDNVSDKTVIEVRISENQNCDEDKTDSEIDLSSSNFIPTSTPFKTSQIPKKTDISNDNFFSLVSEGDEPTHVILGPCEEYGLGLYSGLKTTFGKFSDDDRPEEELLQFSSNFMPFSEAGTTQNSVDYSLETWDKFLGKSLQDQDNCSSSLFDNFSPREDGLNVFTEEKEAEVKKELNKTVVLTKNDETFTIENEAPADDKITKEIESVETEASQSNWEPGEGWFLHPQTSAEELSGQIDVSGSEAIDNSYVGFALDEECVNALRNELAAKLPHAQGLSHEEPQEPEEWDNEERSEIIVKYNVYATPLSPIPEESCCDDVYCDQIQHRDGSDSESDWSEPGLGQTSQLEEDILVVDTETHTALIIESPSFREPQHRHTPSQDSCCSNDTLFNLEDLNYGHSPQHQILTPIQSTEPDSENFLEIEITEDTPKQSPTIPRIETEENVPSSSLEMNLTYTKPDNTTESETSQESDTKANKLELKLDQNSFGVAPLPSPEDIPWRQLPASLLSYSEVVQDNFEMQDETTDTIENVIDEEEDNEELPVENTNDEMSDRECTQDLDLYSNLTDIRFSGPCDAQLMSTSFSESADYAEDKDWDSGSDTRSSSSGEFIWKEGEHEESLRALHAASHDVSTASEVNPMDAIEEENSNSSGDSDDCEEDIEETEFVPSAWDAQATPTKSALRSPEKSTKRKNQQKGVWFKKQKYHCVYEYPREPESPVAPPTDLWRPLADFSAFADWELDPESCVAPSFDESSDSSYDVLDKFIARGNYPLSRNRDLYQLNPFPEFSAGLSGSDEDFFISSSARPFQTVGQSSQFFPGQQPPKSKFLWQDYQSSSQQSSRDLTEGTTPDSGIDDITPDTALTDLLPRNQKIPPLKCLAAIAANKTKTEQKNLDSSLGGLRHTRNRLKLDLPPSPNSFTSRTFSIDVASDPVMNREIPTFTTFGKSRFSVQHVATPTDENSDPLQSETPKTKNVSFEALPHKPMQLTEKVYIMDKSEEDKHKPVEMVQGEASLLDSADEDSGIESSANATLERHQQQILN